ncbi:GGDEF domain-containing protein [Hyphomonas oceanitis]|uniref:diguanylate cyclase n=1 Tax=Hyphomonas oceanitis SCH89 TaxID=1280953 RepID=A0A059G8X1_9PROT|nr:GGDEF domain-containing protein [Hyphomonas oceanitis]KDA02888.1 diguanylate cyclase [Hyphomonas oceanitis SCH89]
MSTGVYFQLMNPLVFGLFSLGFLGIHHMRPSKSTLVISISYVVGAIAFISDLIFQDSTLLITRVPIAGLYAITTCMLVAALFLHYRGKAPWTVLGGLLVVHLAIYSYLMAIEADWIRSFSANAGCGILASIGLFAFRGKLDRTLDRVTFSILALCCAQSFIRPAIIAVLASGPLTNANHSETTFIFAMHFVVGACAVTMGMCLILVFSQAIFNDLRNNSVTDVLTGINNRRGFDEAGNLVLQNSAAQPVSLILADLDHFKSVNDNYGHAFGDGVIASFGALMGDYARFGRVAGRLGGEEFGLLLPGVPLSMAAELAESIRRRFAAANIQPGEPHDVLTASFGVAQYKKEESLSQLMTRADQALYRSKDCGRDRVTCDTEIPDTAAEPTQNMYPATSATVQKLPVKYG